MAAGDPDAHGRYPQSFPSPLRVPPERTRSVTRCRGQKATPSPGDQVQTVLFRAVVTWQRLSLLGRVDRPQSFSVFVFTRDAI